MKYIKTRLGQISSIALGCLQSANQTVLGEAIDAGVNFFVTAEAYGDDNQKSLKEVAKTHFVATKVGINFMGKNPEEQFTQSRGQIKKSVEKCAELLGKKPLDLVGLHRLDDVHQAKDSKGKNVPAWEVALDELITLKKAGYIKHIGLSEPTALQLERAIVIAKEQGETIDAIESAFSIVTRRAETNGVKAICEREGIVFMAYTSVIRGLTDKRLQQISSKDFELSSEEFRKKVFQILGMNGDFVRENIDMFSNENIKHNVKQMLAFQTCADEYKVTPTQLALAWVQHKGAIPIPGSSNPKHVAENLQSAELVDELHKAGAFEKLEKLFPAGTFHGDPNPIAIAGVLDANSAALNQSKKDEQPVAVQISDEEHKIEVRPAIAALKY